MAKINKDIFLETTAIIDAVYKDKDTKERIRNILKDYEKKYTSIYVISQIRNSYIKKLTVIYNKSLVLESYADILSWAINLSNVIYQKRFGDTLLEQILIMFKEIEKKSVKVNGSMNIDNYLRTLLRAQLRILIKNGWREACEEGDVIDEIIDLTGCCRNMLTPPTRNGDFYELEFEKKWCEKTRKICDIDKFVADEKNKDSFARIYSHLKSLEKVGQLTKDWETKERLKTLKVVKNKKNPLIGEDECKSLSDAIIAVESNSENIMNNNDKHFKPICSSINKNSITY